MEQGAHVEREKRECPETGKQQSKCRKCGEWKSTSNISKHERDCARDAASPAEQLEQKGGLDTDII